MKSLSEDQRYTIVHALRVARDRFLADVETCNETMHPRLGQQFQRQANEAEELALLIETVDFLHYEVAEEEVTA